MRSVVDLPPIRLGTCLKGHIQYHGRAREVEMLRPIRNSRMRRPCASQRPKQDPHHDRCLLFPFVFPRKSRQFVSTTCRGQPSKLQQQKKATIFLNPIAKFEFFRLPPHATVENFEIFAIQAEFDHFARNS